MPWQSKKLPPPQAIPIHTSRAERESIVCQLAIFAIAHCVWLLHVNRGCNQVFLHINSLQPCQRVVIAAVVVAGGGYTGCWLNWLQYVAHMSYAHQSLNINSSSPRFVLWVALEGGWLAVSYRDFIQGVTRPPCRRQPSLAHTPRDLHVISAAERYVVKAIIKQSKRRYTKHILCVLPIRLRVALVIFIFSFVIIINFHHHCRVEQKICCLLVSLVDGNERLKKVLTELRLPT